MLLRCGRLVLEAVRAIGTWLHFCFLDRRGFLGIDGPYIDGVFLIREIFQVGYQSIQAWRMSERVPIAWLNRFNVVLVCLNCWSLPVLEWWIMRRTGPTGNRFGPKLAGPTVRYRLPTMVVDCLLDSLAVSLMSIVILTPYLTAFDRTMNMFPPSLWRNDQWLVRVISEFPIVFVINWVDAISRAVFALLTVLSLYAIHELCHDQLERRPVKTTAGVHVLSRDPSKLIHTKSSRSFARQGVHVVLMVWGVVVAVLHIYASWRAPPSHCVLPLQPWAESKPACAAVRFNCYRTASNGSRSSIEPVFQAISSQYVLLIVFEHCPSLEMPRTLQRNSHLVSMTIHNTTIINWDSDTALTSTHHPRLRALQFSRITWPDGGQLPLGLVDASFPQSVKQVFILESNLRTLPTTLHNSWPQHMSFACDACRLSTFPSTLAKLNLVFLSLAKNSLTNLPLPDLLGPTKPIVIIGAAFNPITSLRTETSSSDTGLSTSLLWLVLCDTNLSSLPSWTSRDTPSVLFLMGGSPLCDSVNLSGVDPTVRPRVDCTPPTPWERSASHSSIQDKLHPL